MKQPAEGLSVGGPKDTFTARARGDALPPPPVLAVEEALGRSDLRIDWLAGDGSDRCYYRIVGKNGETFVLMQLSETDAKALRENGYDWIHIGRLLEESGIPVPRLIKALPEYAALIIEDYGDVMFESRALELAKAPQRHALMDLYRQSFPLITHLLTIKASPKAVWCQRAFDEERFVWEMNFLVKNYVEPVANIQFSKSQQKSFDKDIKALGGYLASFSRWFVHRDFHSRNMMWQDNKIAVIDFQDARLGPAAYDLVSLCFDSYVPLEQSERLNLLTEALESIKDVVSSNTAATVEDHWRPMLLQRQLKAVGSFGYLSIKKNRGNYLRYVRPALGTLSGLVEDRRWSFISGEFLTMLEQRLP